MSSEFDGYPLECLKELSTMSFLTRLSLPLSMNSCIMNMPEVVIILTEFTALRQLLLSWGIWNMTNPNGRIQVRYISVEYADPQMFQRLSGEAFKSRLLKNLKLWSFSSMPKIFMKPKCTQVVTPRWNEGRPELVELIPLKTKF